ncbi:MAG: DUF3024 domain-containing protein [Candidatus Marinimicrobia bacterium]|nr:DUF3024 domain-containing protein [Candidatus Neomarinimicrobiota bacterium]
MPFKAEELPLLESYIKQYCDRRNNPDIYEELHLEYEIENQSIIFLEVRQHWQDPSRKTRSAFAKMRFIRSSKKWNLYMMRQDLKWYLYDPFPESQSYVTLLEVIDKDQHGCFYG